MSLYRLCTERGHPRQLAGRCQRCDRYTWIRRYWAAALEAYWERIGLAA